ncbi:hypothetical protein EJD97_008406 [Solanum chilense]|uniref:Uncharacterized protein n=1 Tax=Solanum chilense TaxID=4083 RepID=A0A6N2AHB9_SOLCI|nr:hypothetical protein EJD97_008406 [Solanum chilense]
MTTRICLKKFHLESLGKHGDYFLKCDVNLQLSKTYESQHDGLLRIKIKSFPMLHFATLDALVEYEIYP